MIFSTDKCPLCDRKLRLEIQPVATNKVAFHYYCEKRESICDDKGAQIIKAHHYTNDAYKSAQLAVMLIGPFKLFHSESNNVTAIYDSQRREKGDPKKLIFQTKLLDLDYSQPHLVLDKLKLWVTFS
jgi:hypothetical protein